MTLLAITLAVGIVIDDAIVVLENIFRYMEEKNCSPYQAAVEGTREVALAVMATTLSLVVIFLPIAFMSGYAKRFINPFGWTMAFAILVSMLVSFTLTPMLELAVPEAVGRSRRSQDQGTRVLPLAGHAYAVGELGAGSQHGDHRDFGRDGLLLTIPLNRMVGREFVPNEDMGDWTVHVDAGRHVARRHDRDCLQAAEGNQRDRRRGTDRAVDRRHRSGRQLAHAHSFPLSAADRGGRTARPRSSRDAPAAGGASILPSVDQLAERARQRRRGRRVR